MVIVLPDTLQTFSDICPNWAVAGLSELTSGSVDFASGFIRTCFSFCCLSQAILVIPCGRPGEATSVRGSAYPTTSVPFFIELTAVPQGPAASCPSSGTRQN